MTPDSEFNGVFVDENILGVAHALARLHPDDVYYVGHPAVPEIPASTKDPQLLSALGANEADWIFLTRDKKIRHNVAERHQLMGAGIRAVFLTGNKNMNKEQMIELVEKHWDDIVREVGPRSGPCMWSITKGGGLQEIRPEQPSR